MGRKRKNKQRKIITITSLSLLFILTVGYAAFQTNLNISAKGNIKAKAKTIDDLKKNIVSSGDGLYVDSTEDGRYIYRGTNPDNYITFNGEEAEWRIISLEKDGTIKIVKNYSIGLMPYDAPGTRDSSTSTYCVDSSVHGCNAWSSKNEMVGTPESFWMRFPNGNPNTDTTYYSGTVNANSSLNTYLNNDYYNSLDNISKTYISSHNFNIGTPGYNTDTETITTDVSQEAIYKWNGKIGLMNITEFLKTTLNTNCTNLNVAFNSESKSVCGENNWLLGLKTYDWTLSVYVSSTRAGIWITAPQGYATGAVVKNNGGVRPALYLKSGIMLKGTGTQNDPFEIISKA